MPGPNTDPAVAPPGKVFAAVKYALTWVVVAALKGVRPGNTIASVLALFEVLIMVEAVPHVPLIMFRFAALLTVLSPISRQLLFELPPL